MTHNAPPILHSTPTVISFNAKKIGNEISIGRIACPLHVLELKEGLEGIQYGEVLRVNSNTRVISELVAAARQLASEVAVDGQSTLFITK
ncbi:MAG: hypothetical protein KAG28_07500 [Cocleimonas sp.]|nr:hypothetical protein [Cocleimonas sp.]